MPDRFPRLSIIAALTGLATLTAWPQSDVAQAQFFPGFGAPQQIQTARGAIQLAPGWHVATTPVRTQSGYKVAVRSETGEQRNMVIGVNGAVAITHAQEPRAQRMSAPPAQIRRLVRQQEPRKPRITVAAIRPATKAVVSGGPGAAPAPQPAAITAPISQPQQQPSAAKGATPKWQTPTPSGPQAPGYAHGVPINPLD